jgi:TPR repeat protein
VVAGLLLLSTWLLPGTAFAQFETLARAALVIGNGDYQNEPLSPLDNPLNDAREVNRRLTELGFNVTLMEDGDAAGMDDLVARIPEVFPDGGVGVFYYAGHGVQYKGVNYLLPTDFELTTPEELPRHSLALNTILQAMNDAGVKIGIIILDACRESPFGTVSDAFGQGLALVDAPGETLIAYATRPGGLAEDGTGANSPYTGALISALELPNQSIYDVFAAVRAKVSQATSGRQIPWILGSLGPLGTDFRFRPVAEPQIAESLSVPDGPITLASVHWKTIQQSVDPTDFERFLQMDPQRPYVQLAQRRLSELRSEGREDLPEMGIRLAAATDLPEGIENLITECDVVAADPFDNGRLTAGVPWGLVNTSIAIRACLRSVANQPNSPRLLFNLGRALDIAERFDEAESFYRKAADLGYASAFKNLGYMQRQSRGMPENFEAAAQLYLEAALRGSNAGRTAIATLYREGLGVPQSYEEALRWYRLAAADGYPGALDAIGNFYLNGLGVDQDEAESARYYELAANLGVSNGMYNLGRAYLRGNGVEKDCEQAVSWFVRGLEEGNPYTPFYLGRMFREKWCVERDYRLAMTYFKLAADRGFAEAYYHIAQMYEKGEGVDADLGQAYYYYWIAREAGEFHGVRYSRLMAEEAGERLAALQGQLDSAIVAGARARAEEWIKQNGLLQFRMVNLW